MIHDELDSIFADDIDREVTRDDLKQMDYLELCIKETLRLYPPAGYLGRKITEEFQCGKYRIPEGATTLIATASIHTDPNVYSKPLQFIPERFMPNSPENSVPCAFIPFSHGLRSCIGQRFAMLEIKVTLALVLRRYRIESLTERHELKVSASIVSKSRTPIKVKFIPRR